MKKRRRNEGKKRKSDEGTRLRRDEGTKGEGMKGRRHTGTKIPREQEPRSAGPVGLGDRVSRMSKVSPNEDMQLFRLIPKYIYK